MKLNLFIKIADTSRLKLEKQANKFEDHLNLQIMLKVLIELTQCENDFLMICRLFDAFYQMIT